MPNEKDDKKEEKLIDHVCVECGKVAARIKPGSQIAKGAEFICKKCQGDIKLLKESAKMFRELANKDGKSPFGDVFGDMFNKNIFGK